MREIMVKGTREYMDSILKEAVGLNINEITYMEYFVRRHSNAARICTPLIRQAAKHYERGENIEKEIEVIKKLASRIKSRYYREVKDTVGDEIFRKIDSVKSTDGMRNLTEYIVEVNKVKADGSEDTELNEMIDRICEIKHDEVEFMKWYISRTSRTFAESMNNYLKEELIGAVICEKLGKVSDGFNGIVEADIVMYKNSTLECIDIIRKTFKEAGGKITPETIERWKTLVD